MTLGLWLISASVIDLNYNPMFTQFCEKNIYPFHIFISECLRAFTIELDIGRFCNVLKKSN